jgi:hypothetical protein
VEIVDGLVEDERVIVDGTQNVTDGAAVRELPWDEATEVPPPGGS